MSAVMEASDTSDGASGETGGRRAEDFPLGALRVKRGLTPGKEVGVERSGRERCVGGGGDKSETSSRRTMCESRSDPSSSVCSSSSKCVRETDGRSCFPPSARVCMMEPMKVADEVTRDLRDFLALTATSGRENHSRLNAASMSNFRFLQFCITSSLAFAMRFSKAPRIRSTLSCKMCSSRASFSSSSVRRAACLATISFAQSSSSCFFPPCSLLWIVTTWSNFSHFERIMACTRPSRVFGRYFTFGIFSLSN
mmetsp:Transcript_40542/g.82883  ORF Transcript_40542/g.82883 Transcript_40542/m.82883 type:complete len:253 (-) Transcript_40542:582-1340(-)